MEGGVIKQLVSCAVIWHDCLTFLVTWFGSNHCFASPPIFKGDELRQKTKEAKESLGSWPSVLGVKCWVDHFQAEDNFNVLFRI